MPSAVAPATGSDQAFSYLRRFIYESSAIVLEADKRYLLEARLRPVLAREQMSSFDELVTRMGRYDSAPLRQRVVEAMTTHETLFFRDIHPFQTFRKNIVPQLLLDRAAHKRLNIWCGASSTGQEPFSIALIIKECGLTLAGWNTRILATDLSADIIGRAKAGVFSQLEVNRGLPAAMLVKYFEKVGLDWRLKEDIRKMVEFKQMNLVEAWDPLPEQDVVFLRNVLIYFDVPTKKAVFERLARVVRPGGFLFLGGVETTLNLSTDFTQVSFGNTTVFQRNSRG
jgi:chemotaxis protein methyltransferase CheR